MAFHHVITPGFLLSTQSRTEDKLHNKQNNKGLKEKEPNTKSVCGCVVEIRPQFGLGQRSALMCKQRRVSVPFGDPSGRAFRSSCPFDVVI